MQVLLLEDVDKLGLAGDVVKVSDGFGRNYLIPRRLAKIASAGTLKQVGQVRRAGERKRARELADAHGLAGRIEGLALSFRARAGEKGKLYGSITTADLAQALEAELGQPFDRRKILCDPLRQVGEHQVKVRLMGDVSATLKVVIQPEEGAVLAGGQVLAESAVLAEGQVPAEGQAEETPEGQAAPGED